MRRYGIKVSFVFLSLSGCGVQVTSVDDGSGSGSTTTTFVKASALWNIEAGSGQGDAIVLMSGAFSNDSPYTDLVLLSSTGAFVYKNRAPTANGWESLGRLPATAGGTYLFGIHFDIDLAADSLSDLLLYRQAPGRLEILTNEGNEAFVVSETSPINNSTSWIAWAPFKDRSLSSNNIHVLSVSSTGNHRLSQLDGASFEGSSTAVANTLGAAIRALASDFNADGYMDFLIIPAAGGTAPRFLVNDSDDSFTETNGTLSRPAAASNSDIREAVTGDFDLDGKDDLLFATDTGLELYVNESDEDGIVFTYQADVSFSPNPTDVTWMQYGNLTEDALWDLIIARDGSAPVLFSGRSNLQWVDITTAAFGSELNTPFGSGSSASDITQVHIADVDRDRVNDILVLNEAGDISIYFNQAEDSADSD